ncbi:NfeD family protein [Nakamurella deserti]|uniref:NfeD family protein n=1 Tax=Nakamurella deserti TaxID=2164074 RepID=UPI000DBE2969|nr:NfeD family protein [Nakamurella deserti]
MDTMTLTFLVVGGLSLVLLLISVVIGDVGHFAADADGPFSLPALAAFLGGGGFAGGAAASLLADRLDDTPRLLAALGVGTVVALPLAFGALRLMSGLMRMRTDETLTGAGLLGSHGVVVTAITTPTSFGEVRLTIGGHTLKYYARSQHPLPVGTPVYVVDVPSETSVEVVSTAYDPPAPPIAPLSDHPRSHEPD